MYLYISDTGCTVTEETKCACVAIKLTRGMDMPYIDVCLVTILTCSFTSYNLPRVTNEIRGDLVVNLRCLFIVA